jgi:hypothetical protein
MVQRCLQAALLDEIIINLVPVILGDGVRLFERDSPGNHELAIEDVIAAPGVTHLTYRVVRKRRVAMSPRWCSATSEYMQAHTPAGTRAYPMYGATWARSMAARTGRSV